MPARLTEQKGPPPMTKLTPLFPLTLAAALTGCGRSDQSPSSTIQTISQRSGDAASSAGLGGDAASIAHARKLSPDDVAAALKTYMPSGRHDEFIMFASSGHAGQILVIGVPSMRILRSIAVFTPESWQGWGFGAGNDVLDEGGIDGRTITWGDTHHPALSLTNGDYDGQFLFIGDKAHARMAVIDLRDFETKQIVKNPIAMSDHGGAFATTNTEYVIEGAQYATPSAWAYAPLEKYKESYRGMVTFWKFDRQRGRFDLSQSFAIELPPYWQDLFSVGRNVSEGWVFGNSINTELATGGIEKGQPPFESGVSQNDVDYLHIFNLTKAIEVFKAGKFTRVKNFPVITLQTAVDEGLLYFAPEPKSPHGVDVTPGGEYMVVSGKLDPHVTIYSFAKMQQAIEQKKWAPDAYGVPVLDFDSVVEARVELGLGPLHTQFDDKGYAYTSLFLDSAVARWSLGGPYAKLHREPGWTLVTKTPVHYNIGHLSAIHGDTTNPQGQFLVALNKWSIDRFYNPGPLLPQNLQLIDISQPGTKMPVLYDMPMGVGEPHYAQIIRADLLKPWQVYPEIGWDPHVQAVSPAAPKAGEEGVKRDGSTVEVNMTAIRSHYKPEHVTVKKGDHVIWRITNLERTADATHGFIVPGYNINLSLEPGEYQMVDFVADREGVYPFYCTEFCSALHLEMMGYFIVEP
jgi:nitrous-oxide reductase